MPGRLDALPAVASGMTVGDLYDAQPLLSSPRDVFHISTATAGTLITLTQAGRAIGVLFLVPLGDRLEKRGLITLLLTVTTLAQVAAGLATGFPMLPAASLISGATSVVAQILVPFAASLAPDRARGRIVGRVMSGLLTGILLSRTLSSLVSNVAGWRVVYLGSAALTALPAVALRAARPRHAPTTAVPYVLTGPGFRHTPVGVGLFALVGAAGAAIVPLAGHWADRELARPMTGLAFAVAAAAIAVTAFAVAGFGRHTIYQLDATARAGLNSAFIATLFLGGALGSQLGSIAHRAGGWGAVSILGAALPLLALLYWRTEHRAARRKAAPVFG
ncbi:major facilitator superfamily permease [Streptomyces hygroscopicus subsp. jinggangensis 5008]|nr:major facilitator superfamily permease [Streptomyces hygroscopicus subsp. jinggangensis 5008]AGF61084.1 major facilitator superfamily permease [Streptomyces hygroscopicus subsp. jinggangensis TL01]